MLDLCLSTTGVKKTVPQGPSLHSFIYSTLQTVQNAQNWRRDKHYQQSTPICFKVCGFMFSSFILTLSSILLFYRKPVKRLVLPEPRSKWRKSETPFLILITALKEKKWVNVDKTQIVKTNTQQWIRFFLQISIILYSESNHLASTKIGKKVIDQQY